MRRCEFSYKKYNIKKEDLAKYKEIYKELENCGLEELQKIRILSETKVKVLPSIIGYFLISLTVILALPQIVSIISMNNTIKSGLVVTYVIFIALVSILLIYESKKIDTKVYEGSIISEICKNLIEKI